MAQLKGALAERALASGLVEAADWARCRAALGDDAGDARLLEWLIKHGHLTKWQAAQLEAGRTQNLILSHYKLLAPLGAGGMGTVFRALDTKLNRQVALKILPPRLATPDAIGRFRREGFVALQMRHDNVVASFELAQHGTIHFLVMELVDGPSLSAHLGKQRRLSVRETARIGLEVTLALQHAHEQAIIHRDIKPSNILLSRLGQVKVADMGLAKFFGPQAQAGGPETRTGQFMGTIDYCSPEQAVDAKRADIRSDIYSLGCTLYHCLTGQPPFAEGTEVQRIMAHIDILPASIRVRNRDVPLAFAELIEKRMLSKDPGDRFQTPAEAAEALVPWAKAEEGSAANPWAGLEGLDGLLEIAAQAPRIDVPRAAPQSGRDTARRLRSPITRRAVKLRIRTKGKSVLRGPMGWAALVLVVLGAAVAAALWWPRKNPEGAVTVANAEGEGKSPQKGKAVVPRGSSEKVAEPPTVGPPKVADTDGGGAGETSVGPADPKPASNPRAEPGSPKAPGLLLTVKHGAPVSCVAVSADGSTLITGGTDKTARLWNAADGAARGAPLVHDRNVWTVSLSADGRYAITEQPVTEHSGWSLVITNAGKMVAGGSDEKCFTLWDLSTDTGDGRKALFKSRGPLALSANGEEALALDWDNNGTAWLRRYDLANGQWRDAPLAPPDAASPLTQMILMKPALFSPDLKLLASAGDLFDQHNGNYGQREEHYVRFWDTSTGRIVGKSERFARNIALWQTCAFHPDSHAFAVAIGTIPRDWKAQFDYSNPRLQLLDVSNARVLSEFDLPGRLREIVFSPSADLMACSFVSNPLELRDAKTGELRGPRSPIGGAVAFSGDGKRLFIGKSDGTAELWELDALLDGGSFPRKVRG